MIARDLGALGGHFDIAIVGGGIYGVALAFEASRRGLRAALVEKNDFGSASSANSLRILHGGLRYLQSLDLPRFRESVSARKWYAQHFPDYVRSLPCLLPLYGRGAKRPSVMRVALRLNDLLSSARNDGLNEAVCLPAGRILDRAETLAAFPAVRPQGLVGAALWYDYQMVSSERILIEMLRTSGRLGAVAVNYAEATRFCVKNNRVLGIDGTDRISGSEFHIDSPLVVNCAGPACAELASRAGATDAEFAPASVAFNVLFESPAMGQQAMGVTAPETGAAVHFICPSRHGLWAGTAHVPRRRASEYPAAPTDAEVEGFVGSLQRAVPAFPWTASRIRKVCWGVLPVKREQTIDLTTRAELVSHARVAAGLYSLVGIKFTTAAQEARKALERIFGPRLPGLQSDVAGSASFAQSSAVLIDGDRAAGLERSELIRIIQTVAAEEAVIEADDLMLRRTNWLFSAKEPAALRAVIETALSQSVRSTTAAMMQSHASLGG